MALHTLGGRYAYSNVPYDDWARALAGTTLVGQAIDRVDVQAIADLAIADSAPFDDGHASAAYRRSVGRRIFASSLAQALDRRLAA